MANHPSCANQQYVRIDATSLPPDAELEAEVAVVGAGPAGITLALELAGAGHSVVLIESGRVAAQGGLELLDAGATDMLA